MDITQLQYFKVIAETGSLTKAAETLHVSQPAMSAMLKKFEEELNVELFDRSPNRIFLNQTGEIALVHINHILQNVEQMKTDLLNAAQQNLTLRIAFCDPGVRWFTVPRFTIAYPEIQIKDELYEGTEAAKLLSDRVYDLIVTPHFEALHSHTIPKAGFVSLYGWPDEPLFPSSQNNSIDNCRQTHLAGLLSAFSQISYPEWLPFSPLMATRHRLAMLFPVPVAHNSDWQASRR